MRVQDNSLRSYFIKIESIFNQINDEMYVPEHLNVFYYNTIENVLLNPNPNPNQPWSTNNVRYGFQNSLVGLIGEYIAAVNLSSIYNTVEIATSREDQVKNQIDLFTPIGTVQVKAIRILNGMVEFPSNWKSSKADFFSLVDIDYRYHLLIKTEELQMSTKTIFARSTLGQMCYHSFDNRNLYG